MDTTGRQRDRRERPQPRWVAAYVAAAVAAFAAVTLVQPGGEGVSLVIVDLGAILLAAVAALTCLGRARREVAGPTRRGWLLLATGAGWWTAGQAAWAFDELVLGRDPYPSFAEIGYLVSIPFVIAALVAWFSPPAGLTSLVRTVLDGVVVSTALLYVSWELVLASLFADGDAPWFDKVIGLTYPAADVVVLTVVVLVAGRTILDWGALRLVALGLALYALSDSAFAYVIQRGDYEAGDVVGAGWGAAYLLVTAAASRPPGGRQPVRRWRLSRVAVLNLPLAAGTAVAAYRAAVDRQLSGASLWLALVAVGSVILRDLVTARENRRLRHNLEAQVAERTAELRASELRFRSLIQNVSDVVSVVDRDGRIAYCSPSVRAVFGVDPADVVGIPVFGLLHRDDRPPATAFFEDVLSHGATTRRLDVRLRHHDGSWRHTETIGAAYVDDDAIGGIVLTTRDVTDRRNLEQQLVHQALHDPLTGLANRVLFSDRLAQALPRARRAGAPLGLVYVDLDDFKSVNDTLGHGYGDALLQEVGARLTAAVRPGDTVARLGGDEFAVLIEGAGTDEVVGVVRRFEEALAEPVVVAGSPTAVSASIGVVVADPSTTSAADAADADDLLRDADVAMYRAKARGKGGHQLFDPEMRDETMRRALLLRDLRTAVEHGGLELHYQPLVQLDGGRIVGFEALARWHHPTHGWIPPVEFVPLAEESGLIVALGEWVLREATTQLAAWDALHPDPDGEPLTISVNVSGRQLHDDGFVSAVADATASAGIDPARLTLELTESILLDGIDEILSTLHDLKALGVLLAIDDFGTGFSSLGYLRRFPVDLLKIDRSFVEDLVDGHRGVDITRAVVEMSRVLGLDTVAEGIEEPDQAALLRVLGCRYGQGYAFARPMSDAQVADLLAAGEWCGAGTR